MIKEYGGLEKYKSKAAMKKHESKETPSKEKGEMGYPSTQKQFDAAMQKEWESRKQGAPGKTKPETKAEAEDRERGKVKDKAKTISRMRKIIG